MISFSAMTSYVSLYLLIIYIYWGWSFFFKPDDVTCLLKICSSFPVTWKVKSKPHDIPKSLKIFHFPHCSLHSNIPNNYSFLNEPFVPSCVCVYVFFWNSPTPLVFLASSYLCFKVSPMKPIMIIWNRVVIMIPNTYFHDLYFSVHSIFYISLS